MQIRYKHQRFQTEAGTGKTYTYVKHVYFVAESKGNDLQNSQLRGSEESRIECARRHFKAISDNGYIYDVAKDYKKLYDIVTK